LYAENTPKLGAFFQAGYGKPGLDMLRTDFTDFYIGGLRLSWALDGFYSLSDDLNKIEVDAKMLEAQRETFLYNNDLKIAGQKNEIQKLQELIRTDDDVIALRTRIKETAEAKYANGTQTVSDLIREITAENLAIQKKYLHEIQLLLAVYNLKFTVNK
jgi:outer membrane protein TolC